MSHRQKQLSIVNILLTALALILAISITRTLATTGTDAEFFDGRVATGLDAGEGRVIRHLGARGSISPTFDPAIAGTSTGSACGGGGPCPFFILINCGFHNIYPTEIVCCGAPPKIPFGPTEVPPGPPILTPLPVTLPYGDKYESSVDLSVNVTAGAFNLIRTYSSSLDFTSAGLVGENWIASPFLFLEIAAGADPDLTLAALDMREHTFEYDSGDDAWYTTGPTDEYIVESEVTIGSDKWATWKLVWPGAWEMHFLREHDASDGFTATPAERIGLLIYEQDPYGNNRVYAYTTYGTSTSNARLNTITLTANGASNEDAIIDFEWIEDDQDDNGGRLDYVKVTRHDGGNDTETQRVEYRYKDDAGGLSSTDGLPGALGTEGDLIEVRHWIKLDNSNASPDDTWRLLVTQYRYHGGLANESGSDLDGDFYIEHGSAHQLKMIFLPEQIEYVGQKHAEAVGGASVDTLSEAADEILKLGDGDKWHSTLTGTLLVDAAAKVVARYETSGQERVEDEYIQSTCGCGGASTQGMLLEHEYFSYVSAVYTDTIKITEKIDTGSGFTTHKTHYYDLDTPGTGTVPYVINKAIVDGSDAWVEHYEYDSTLRTVTKHVRPSAMKTYTAGTSGAAGSYTSESAIGLAYSYTYSADGPYLLESAIGKGDEGAHANFDLVSKRTRGDTDRPWLISKVERYSVAGTSNADEIETYEIDYGFHTTNGNDIAWIEVKSEAELEAENGPSGTGNTYDWYRLIDSKGRPVWERHEDSTLTRRTFDDHTGLVASEARNSQDTVSAPWTNIGPTGAGSWGGTGDDLKITTTRDLLGRPTKIERFASSTRAIDTFLVREMKDLTERDGIKYYVQARFPHVIAGGASGSYGGMATVNWIGAGGKVLRSSGYEPVAPGSSVYDTDPIADALGDELTKSSVDHHVSGLAEARHVWYDLADVDGYATTSYAYDALGRMETITSPMLTITRHSYDILDRRIRRELGTDDDPSTGNMKTVTEWFHDSGGTATPGVGNGNVTLIRQHVDDSTTRDTKITYDHRDRPVKTQNPLAPHSYTVYDNLDRQVETAVFKSVPTDIETPLADRGRYTVTHYSQRGKVYLVQNPIDPAEDSGGMGFSGYLETNTWFDEVGRSIATWSPSSPGRKTVYDDLGRVETVYVTDRSGDDDPGAAGNYADADDVTGDLVIEQTDYRYIADTTLTDLVTRRVRAHDASSSDTGALDALASAKKITTYSASYFDDANRPIRSVSYGTNTTGFVHGGSAPTVNQASPPDHNTAGAQLVNATAYNERGMVESTTDPEGAVTKTFYDDMNRRVAVIENYDDAVVTWDPPTGGGDGRWEITGLDIAEPDTDRGVTFTYDDSSNLILRIAFLPKSGGGEDIQETEYVYGVSVTSGNKIASNDMLDHVNYPNESTGGKGSTTAYRFNYEYNRQGETVFTNDQNRIQHVLTRDARGRVTKDEITGWGSATNIDQWIDRIETTYDSFGRREFVRSKDGSTIKNAVKFKYDAQWRVSELWQDHDGDVDENGMGTNSQVVEYANDDAKMADGNYARLESITYPDGAVIDTDYGTASALNDVISRAEAIKIGSDTIVSYDFVGSGMYAKVKYPQSEIRLDRTVAHNGSRTSGQYPGWDAFGRIENQIWVDDSLTTHVTDTTVPNIPPIVELEYAYDKSNNRTHKYDVRPGALRAERDQQYTYDGLDRLTEAKRGAWNGTSFTLGNDSEKWTLDMLGNWNYLDTDFNGDGNYSTTTERDDRTHNSANELTQRILKGQDGMGGDETLSLNFDDTGNIKDAHRPGLTQVTYKHDGWNRLVETKFGSNVRAEYEYNGLNWRTVATLDADATHDGTADQERVMYYDQSWRLIEEHIDDDLNVSAGADRTLQYLWGNRYIDDIVYRRENADLTDDSPSVTYNNEWNYLTDAMFSVVAIVKERNAVLAERVRYDAYGNARHQRSGDVDGDGDTDGADNAVYLVASGKSIGQAGYNADADVNRDGTVNSTDGTLITNDFGSALAKGQLSNVDNVIGFDGYVLDAPNEVYTVRNRSYDFRQGRWVERDPLDYIDSSSLFCYGSDRPTSVADPQGAAIIQIIGGCAIGGAIGGIGSYIVCSANPFASGCIQQAACGAAAGCLGGALAATFPTTLGACAGGVLAAVAEAACNEYFNPNNDGVPDMCDAFNLAVATLVGCLGGALSENEITTLLEQGLVGAFPALAAPCIEGADDVGPNECH